MPLPAIRFDGVSKRYRRRTATLGDRLTGLLSRRQARASTAGEDDFWALHDVTFAVRAGETLGVIGANGAGKSTLLKLIAGITAPTAGRVGVDGRVGTLIDLGAGFVPDLTARENVFLCGALYGLTRKEIAARFDQIAAFSGLETFLDVPVKYYSSGMYARLGFSIAIHIQADIVLADDVLSVGDASFQRQCLQRFEDLKRSATIVFVSHDLPKIRQVCDRVLWIKDGRLALQGRPDETIDAYLECLCQERDGAPRGAGKILPDGRTTRWGSGELEITSVTTCDEKGQEKAVFRCHDPLLVRIAYRVRGALRDPGFGVNICTQDGVLLHGSNTFARPEAVTVTGPEGALHVFYPRLPLLHGSYSLTVGAASGNNWAAPYDLWEGAVQFEVLHAGTEAGSVSFEHVWSDHVPA